MQKMTPDLSLLDKYYIVPWSVPLTPSIVPLVFTGGPQASGTSGVIISRVRDLTPWMFIRCLKDLAQQYPSVLAIVDAEIASWPSPPDFSLMITTLLRIAVPYWNVIEPIAEQLLFDSEQEAYQAWLSRYTVH